MKTKLLCLVGALALSFTGKVFGESLDYPTFERKFLEGKSLERSYSNIVKVMNEIRLVEGRSSSALSLFSLEDSTKVISKDSRQRAEALLAQNVRYELINLYATLYAYQMDLDAAIERRKYLIGVRKLVRQQLQDLGTATEDDLNRATIALEEAVLQQERINYNVEAIKGVIGQTIGMERSIFADDELTRGVKEGAVIFEDAQLLTELAMSASKVRTLMDNLISESKPKRNPSDRSDSILFTSLPGLDGLREYEITRSESTHDGFKDYADRYKDSMFWFVRSKLNEIRDLYRRAKLAKNRWEEAGATYDDAREAFESGDIDGEELKRAAHNQKIQRGLYEKSSLELRTRVAELKFLTNLDVFEEKKPIIKKGSYQVINASNACYLTQTYRQSGSVSCTSKERQGSVWNVTPIGAGLYKLENAMGKRLLSKGEGSQISAKITSGKNAAWKITQNAAGKFVLQDIRGTETLYASSGRVRKASSLPITQNAPYRWEIKRASLEDIPQVSEEPPKPSVLRHIKLECSSRSHRKKECRLGKNMKVERIMVTERLSDKKCRHGSDWGYRSGVIWVKDGCRAIFKVTGRI